MKIIGIIAEYNPLHNGHIYLAQKAREDFGADYVIATMSGNFSQRGEPTICDKWSRAKAAVTASETGIDVVFELPFAFACNRAENFAKGGVEMLVKLGVNCIAFGCEADNPDELRRLAINITKSKDLLTDKTYSNMKKGISYVKAYENSVRELFGEDSVRILSTPNNILAVEYLKNIYDLREMGIAIDDIPIKRIGSGYHEVGETYAGAAKIREKIINGEDFSRFVPFISNYEDYPSITSKYFEMIKTILLRTSINDLSMIYCVGEGFENKLLKEIVHADNLDNYISRLVSKRYTAATVKRMLTYILLGISGNEMDKLVSHGIEYGRLLATGKKGRQFLRDYESDRLNIVTNVNNLDRNHYKNTEKLLLLDFLASDMYNLICGRDMYSFSDKVICPFIA